MKSRMSGMEKKGGLTGLPCPNGTSTTAGRGSRNSMPPSFRLRGQFKKGFRTNSKKFGQGDVPLCRTEEGNAGRIIEG
jgi:hypothetical protein